MRNRRNSADNIANRLQLRNEYKYKFRRLDCRNPGNLKNSRRGVFLMEKKYVIAAMKLLKRRENGPIIGLGKVK